MADIKLRIEVNPNAETERLGDIVNVGGSGNLSNVSYKLNADDEFVVGDSTRGREMLSFAGGLRFNSEGLLINETSGKVGLLSSESNPDMFVWGAVDSSGQYSVKLTFENATALKDIVVYGDPISNQFPTRAIVDGAREITSNDNRWAINLGEESSTHTIEFTHWNRPNYNACLTVIMVMLRYYDLGIRNGLKNVDSISQSTGQPNSISYGILANTGSFSIVDVDNEIKDMVLDGVISNSNTYSELIVNNKKVATHISNDTKYDLYSRIFSSTLTDELSLWDDIKLPDVEYQGTSSSLYDVLVRILDLSGISYDVAKMTEDIIYTNSGNKSVKEYLQSFTIDFPYIESGTLREAITNVCEIAQLNLYKTDNGDIKFRSARPRKKPDDTIIVVPTRTQIGAFDVDLIVKNRVDNVTISSYKYEYEDGNFGDSQSLTFNEFSNNEWTIKTGDIPEQYQYTQTIQYFDDGTQAWYGEIVVEFNDDVIFSRNHKLKYQPSLYSYDSTIKKEEDNTDGIIYLDIPAPSTRPSNFKPEYDNRYTPKIYTEYNDKKHKIIIHLAMWVGGAIGEYYEGYNTRRYVYLTNLSLELLCQNLQQKQEKNTYGSGQYNFEIDFANSLMQSNKDVPRTVANNVIADYSKGVRTAKITVECLDYYDINGNKVKTWSNGDVIEVGDVVRVDKNNFGDCIVKNSDGTDVYFKVVGRTFHYEGVPTIDLELQEIT